MADVQRQICKSHTIRAIRCSVQPMCRFWPSVKLHGGPLLHLCRPSLLPKTFIIIQITTQQPLTRVVTAPHDTPDCCWHVEGPAYFYRHKAHSDLLALQLEAARQLQQQHSSECIAGLRILGLARRSCYFPRGPNLGWDWGGECISTAVHPAYFWWIILRQPLCHSSAGATPCSGKLWHATSLSDTVENQSSVGMAAPPRRSHATALGDSHHRARAWMLMGACDTHQQHASWLLSGFVCRPCVRRS